MDVFGPNDQQSVTLLPERRCFCRHLRPHADVDVQAGANFQTEVPREIPWRL